MSGHKNGTSYDKAMHILREHHEKKLKELVGHSDHKKFFLHERHGMNKKMNQKKHKEAHHSATWLKKIKG